MVNIKDVKTIFSIAATIIGTVVGAGFASGQEIYRFFAIYGAYGFGGLFFSIWILALAVNKVFKIGLGLRTNSYRDILCFLLGPRLVPWADLFLLLFFLLLIGVMFAGSGAIFTELNFGYWIGIVATALIAMLVLFQGLQGLVNINLIIIPIMFLVCLLVSGYAIYNKCTPMADVSISKNWFLAALQFASYNLILSIPVLLALANDYPNPTLLKIGSWLGCICLGALAVLINGSIVFHLRHLHNNALPMVFLAKQIGGWVFWFYTFVLWGEMLTTLLANIYGLSQRLAKSNRRNFKVWVVVLCISGIIISRFGFVRLIAVFYPIYGYISLLLLILILVKQQKVLKSQSYIRK